MAELEYITYEDVVRQNYGCVSGVLQECIQKNIFHGSVDDLLRSFPDENHRILKAAKLDGSGDGYGSGYGGGA